MVAGSADEDRAEEKHSGHEESINDEELHWNENHEQRSQKAAERTMAMTMGNVAVNTRPKGLRRCPWWLW